MLIVAGALSLILFTRSAVAPATFVLDFSSVTICWINGCDKSFSDKYLLALKSIMLNPAPKRSFCKSDIAVFLSPREPP